MDKSKVLKLKETPAGKKRGRQEGKLGLAYQKNVLWDETNDVALVILEPDQAKPSWKWLEPHTHT